VRSGGDAVQRGTQMGTARHTRTDPWQDHRQKQTRAEAQIYAHACRIAGVVGPYTYALACMLLTVAAIVNSAL
jgi:hypothetical protein